MGKGNGGAEKKGGDGNTEESGVMKKSLRNMRIAPAWSCSRGGKFGKLGSYLLGQGSEASGVSLKHSPSGAW